MSSCPFLRDSHCYFVRRQYLAYNVDFIAFCSLIKAQNLHRVVVTCYMNVVVYYAVVIRKHSITNLKWLNCVHIGTILCEIMKYHTFLLAYWL